MLVAKHVLRALVFVFAVFGAALGISTPASAQSNTLYGGWCGQISWANGGTSDTWLLFLQNQGWSSSLTAGDLGNGTYTLSGNRITFRQTDAPHTVITATVNGERINGTATNDRGERGTFAIGMLHPPGGPRTSSPIPPDFSVNAAREALNGDREGIAQAVTWGWTPQGSDYWRTIYNSTGPLPAAARSALQDWINRYNAGEQPVCEFRLVGANTVTPSVSFAGTWNVHVNWSDGQTGDTVWTVRDNGTYASSGGSTGNWSQSGNSFSAQFNTGEARCRYQGSISGNTASGSVPATPDCLGGTFSMTRASGGGGGGGASWRAIAGDWSLVENLRGNTCSRYYRFVDRGTYLQWFTGESEGNLGEQTSGGTFRDMGGGRIFYNNYDDQYFQIIGGQLVRTDAQGNRYCTFRRVR